MDALTKARLGIAGRGGPRPSSSYRAARRNAVLRPALGRRGVWRSGVEMHYEPYRPRERRRKGSMRVTMQFLLQLAATSFMPMRLFRAGLRRP